MGGLGEEKEGNVGRKGGREGGGGEKMWGEKRIKFERQQASQRKE